MSWQLKEIDWSAFDRSKVQQEVLAVLKAAALVEYNAPDYVEYLKGVFQTHPSYIPDVDQWGREERQHGLALKQWVELADPSFDFDLALNRFNSVYQVPKTESGSVRGSVVGEMLSRCIVESATSFFYTAIKDKIEEPCLKQICQFIARDEFRHYQMFLRIMNELGGRPGWLKLGKVAFERIREVEDEELASAYWASNQDIESKAFDLEYHAKKYNQLSLNLYQKDHVYRLSSMIARPLGINPWGRVMSVVSPIVWKYWNWNLSRLEAALERAA